MQDTVYISLLHFDSSHPEGKEVSNLIFNKKDKCMAPQIVWMECSSLLQPHFMIQPHKTSVFKNDDDDDNNSNSLLIITRLHDVYTVNTLLKHYIQGIMGHCLDRAHQRKSNKILLQQVWWT